MESHQPVIPFTFEGRGIRVVDKHGNPWFVLGDVCRILEIANTSDAASRLDEDERSTLAITEGHINQGLSSNSPGTVLGLVNEPGLYRLISTSRKEAAKRMMKWVFTEVLPQIRKTGQYGAPSAAPIELSRMDLIQLALAAETELQEEREKTTTLEAKIEADAPKIEFADSVAAAPDAISIGQAAKILGTGRTRLAALMRQAGWLTRLNEPYQVKINAGLLDVKISKWEHPKLGLQRCVTALVTGKGLLCLRAIVSPQSTH